jgi:lysozyme family protein
MKSNFNDCLTRLLKDEGGYTNNPNDPGGPTNFGITLTDYRKYIDKKGTAADVRKMDVEQAKAIYKSKYWDAMDCDSLSSGVDYTVFDYAVNSGLVRPQRDLQKFSKLSGAALINAINDERMAFLRGLNTFPTFGKGWTKRVAGVRAHSLDLAKTNTAAGPTAAGTVAAGSGYILYTHLHQHPYLAIAGAIAAAGIIGLVVHYIFNKGK